MGIVLSRALRLLFFYKTECVGNLNTFRLQVTQAVEKGNVEALEEMGCSSLFGRLEQTCKPPLSLLAVSHGHLDVLRFLIRHGQNVDATDTCGMSALHEACKRGHYTCLEEMLPCSHDVDSKDNWGRTPLMKALVYGHTDAAKILLEWGANPNSVDRYGMTPLTTVIDYQQLDMIQTLVQHGADLNLISWYRPHQCSGPPLYRAINNQSLDVVQELLRLGASTQPDREWGRRSGQNLDRDGDGLTSTPFSAHIRLHLVSRCPAPQYDNAVSMAMSKLLDYTRDTSIWDDGREGRGHRSRLRDVLVNILMTVLAAHGFPLAQSTPEVMARVLARRRNAGQAGGHGNHREMDGPASLEPESAPDAVNMLLVKLHLCSTSCQEMMSLDGLSDADDNGNQISLHANTDQDLRGEGRGGGNNHMGTVRLRPHRPGGSGNTVVSLHLQARRAARRALMASGSNVIWATSHLAFPPALKTQLLLKDVDRAYTPRTSLKCLS